ncbi:SAF domain-containing protein [Paenibacillus sp. RC67]|uniref:SAF domain-containing protein n=1 Tax=Paenibacillus sp. RC67 TaxID=3039392 RepID=UPI0024AD2062|nr:SAF domain-containing protein [Paenibacillus sp. RC67]
MNFWYKCMYYVLVIGLCLSGPALLIGWKWGVEPRWGTVEVLQASRTVERGGRLSEADLKTVKLKKELLVDGAIDKLPRALGQETTRVIRANEQITDAMLNTSHLLPGLGEWNMSLPAEWMFGKPPGSLLRGDRVSLLLVQKEEAKKAEDKSGQELTREKLETLNIPFEEEKRLQEIVVSFVKGSNNQEIASTDDRKKTTGAVTTVELIVNEEQKELIRKYGTKGYRFLIVYR